MTPRWKYLLVALAYWPLLFGVFWLLTDAQRDDRLGFAALRATVWLVAWFAMLAIRRRFVDRAPEPDRASTRWRGYDGDRPGRWRRGAVRRTPDGTALLLRRGHPPVALRELREAAPREPTWSEAFRSAGEVRVLELTLADGARLDLLLEPVDAHRVRGWAGEPALTP